MSAVPTTAVLRQVRPNKATFNQGNLDRRTSSNTRSAGESIELFMKVILLQRLQVLAGFEAYGLSGRDIDFRTCPWVPADTGLSRLYRKDPEAPQLDSIIGLEGVFHAIEDCVHCLFRFRLADSRPLNDLIHKIEFDHRNLRISFVHIFLTSGVVLGNAN